MLDTQLYDVGVLIKISKDTRSYKGNVSTSMVPKGYIFIDTRYMICHCD